MDDGGRKLESKKGIYAMLLLVLMPRMIQVATEKYEKRKNAEMNMP